MNEHPPTEVPSTQLGVIPTEEALAKAQEMGFGDEIAGWLSGEGKN